MVRMSHKIFSTVLSVATVILIGFCTREMGNRYNPMYSQLKNSKFDFFPWSTYSEVLHLLIT